MVKAMKKVLVCAMAAALTLGSAHLHLLYRARQLLLHL